MSDDKSSKKKRKYKPNPRRMARERIVQALYQWQVSDLPMKEIIEQFMLEHVINGTDTAFFQSQLEGVAENTKELDDYIRPLCRQDFDDMNEVELAVLRSAVYELINRQDVPYKVVINEAIDMAKAFGAEEGYRFINSVLHQLAPRIREHEAQYTVPETAKAEVPDAPKVEAKPEVKVTMKPKPTVVVKKRTIKRPTKPS